MLPEPLPAPLPDPLSLPEALALSLDPLLPSAVVESLGCGVELDVVGAGVLDDDAAGVLPSAVVVSGPAPGVLEVLPAGYGVELDVVGAGVLDDDAAGVLPSAVVVSGPAPGVLEEIGRAHV